METRTFGRTGHASTVAIFGACALGYVTQAQADAAMQQVIEAGINHIDIAPSYGNAEAQIAHWMKSTRDQFFLGCKTMERTKKGAAKELAESLKRLHTDHFDLYQIHAVTSMDELEQATAAGGALEAMLEARQAGLIQHIGITGHGLEAPAVFLEALRRFDFDSVLFPVSFILYANPSYRKAAGNLISVCRQKNVGVMAIKYAARGPWEEKPKTFTTWYEPFTAEQEIQNAVNFALSQEVTGLCTPCDVSMLPKVVSACQNYEHLNDEAQESLIASANTYTPLFV